MKKVGRAKKPAAKPKADRTNKQAEVIEMMKRAKGATLPEIMKATAGSRTRSASSSAGHWERKMGLALESNKREDGEELYKIAC